MYVYAWPSSGGCTELFFFIRDSVSLLFYLTLQVYNQWLVWFMLRIEFHVCLSLAIVHSFVPSAPSDLALCLNFGLPWRPLRNVFAVRFMGASKIERSTSRLAGIQIILTLRSRYECLNLNRLSFHFIGHLNFPWALLGFISILQFLRSIQVYLKRF